MSQLKKYKRLKYLGKGSYGAAILVELRSNPSQRFVIKEIVIGHLKPAEQAAAKSEAEVLHQMNHSNITMYIESFVENAKLYIVMENADGGDLSAAIQSRRKEMKYYDEEEVMRIFVQICLALKHVHNQNILHRDLKSQNIFLTSKGVVKLGDFGIAKVLDATDDQARTQIGTPYYLSPEICESKPYGRESDVWSLGVLLYELIALEMPFQATSLPALVHRICVAEPNYHVVEKRYSPGLISLTKSMLMKDPQKRPSVNQVVRSDFIKTHISRLLSYTLKSGTGGVEGSHAPVVLPPTVRPSNVHNLSVEEAEKCIESVHSQFRDQESKEVRSQSNREAARIAEREKLRKFRNDMAKVGRKEPETEVLAPAPEESKDEEGRVPYRPAPRVVVPGPRNMSPKGNYRQVSPKVARPLSPKLGPRAVSPKAPVARNVSPKAGARNISPVNLRAGAGAGNGRDGALTPRGRAAAQAQKERDSKVVAAAAMKQGIAREESQYDRRDMRPQQNAQQVVTRNGSGNDEYVDIARREFFANRAAAQAVKAKVEAYNRNGGERMSMNGGGGYAGAGAGAGAGPNVVAMGGVRSNAGSRRNSEVDHCYAPEEASQYGEPAGYGKGNRASLDNMRDDGMSEAERRIAQIKQQRERDKERENAQKEMELKEALEANRNLIKRQGTKSAIAFDIDLGGGGGGAHAAAPKVRTSAARQSFDDKPGASPMSASPSVGSVAGHALRGRLREDKETTPPTTDSDSGRGRSRKSWGPPIAAGDIAKGVVRYSEQSTPVSQMFAPPEPLQEEQYFDEEAPPPAAQAGHRREFSRDSIDVLPAAEEDQVVLQRLESKRNSQLEVRQQAKEVFKKLREKRRSEAVQKQRRPSGADAKVVEHPTVSPVKRANPEESVPRVANASPLHQQRLMEMLDSVECAKESVQKALGARSRSNSESQAGPSLPPSGASARKDSFSTPPRKAPIAAAAARHASDIRDVQALDQHVSVIQEEEDDELGYTLENWLTQQKRGVTQRKKPGYGAHAGAAGAGDTKDDDALVEDSVDGYSTVPKYARMFDGQAKESADEVYDDRHDFYISGTYADSGKEDEDRDTADTSGGSAEAGVAEEIVRGKYLGNDVEVVGLQCMLAKALMGEGEDED